MDFQSIHQAKEYKPSEEFVDNRWRNAWNAVYVAGGWRLVQPNWAAMQVQTKVGKKLDFCLGCLKMCRQVGSLLELELSKLWGWLDEC